MAALPWAPTQLLSFSETELPSWGETGPTVQQDPDYGKEKEKVGCQRGLGQPGWGNEEGGWLLRQRAGSLRSGVSLFLMTPVLPVRSHSVSCQDSGHLESEVYGSDLHLQPWRRPVC